MTQINIADQSKGAFAAALSKAAIGDEIVYHIGEYCSGSHKAMALGAYDAGLCTLYQRKEGPGRFVYIAQKIARRKK